MIAVLLTLLCLLAFAGCEEDRESSGYKCLVCHDTGIVECASCHGTGRYGENGVDCPACYGEGENECLLCQTDASSDRDDDYDRSSHDEDHDDNNSGSITPGFSGDIDLDFDSSYPSSCARCGNKGWITCTGCDGTGTLPDTQYAPDFGGFGSGMAVGGTTCRTCGGNKLIDCPYC